MKPAAGRRQDSSDREVLAGLVERVTFHNLENGFCVLRTKARGHRDLVTVVGHAAMVGPGEWITASGEWVNDRTHGQQFKARFMRTSEPSSVEGIEKYLGSGMIRGIGPVYARKLVRAFGEKVFDVIEAEPERLREVTGIGKVRAKRITDAWAEQKVIREIMVFLHSHGVGTARAVRIFRTYGADAVEVMTENPYRLARDIRGIGFVTADAIAMKLGIAKTAMVRVRAGIGYALTEAMDEGHCGLPEEELGPLAAKLLEVPGELIRAALDLELAEGTVVADTVGEIPCIFLGGLHRAERAIAGRLLGIAFGNLPWPDIDPGKALPWVERKTGLALAPRPGRRGTRGALLEGRRDAGLVLGDSGDRERFRAEAPSASVPGRAFGNLGNVLRAAAHQGIHPLSQRSRAGRAHRTGSRIVECAGRGRTRWRDDPSYGDCGSAHLWKQAHRFVNRVAGFVGTTLRGRHRGQARPSRHERSVTGLSQSSAEDREGPSAAGRRRAATYSSDRQIAAA